MQMRTSNKGINLIKGFEQFRSDAYLPTPDDVPTQGYGSTRRPDGTRIKLGDPPIDEATAVEWLRHDVRACEDNINREIRVALTQNQFDALVSFDYNVGDPNFDSSTLLKRLNAGNYQAAADELLRWNKQRGKVLRGLVRRREAERELFLEV